MLRWHKLSTYPRLGIYTDVFVVKYIRQAWSTFYDSILDFEPSGFDVERLWYDEGDKIAANEY